MRYSNVLAERRLEGWVAKQLAVSAEGCPFRGTVECFTCPLAAAACLCRTGHDYACGRCAMRERCVCGWADPERREQVWAERRADVCGVGAVAGGAGPGHADGERIYDRFGAVCYVV